MDSTPSTGSALAHICPKRPLPRARTPLGGSKSESRGSTLSRWRKKKGERLMEEPPHPAYAQGQDGPRGDCENGGDRRQYPG